MAHSLKPVYWVQQDLMLHLYIQPKAHQDRWIGVHQHAIKVTLRAPPVNNQANLHLVRWLAKECHVAKTDIQILKGLTSRHKLIKISHLQHLPKPIRLILKEV